MQKITPHIWFVNEAREAAEFYTSVFPKSKIRDITTLSDTPSGTVGERPDFLISPVDVMFSFLLILPVTYVFLRPL